MLQLKENNKGEMPEEIQNKYDYTKLKAEIEFSRELDEKTENSLSSALKEGRELVKKAHEINPDLASKFTKEYTDLTQEIKNELAQAKNGVRDGIDGVMLELKDLKDLADKENITGEKAWYSSV